MTQTIHFKFAHGDRVRHLVIPKYTGIIMSQHNWFNGCVRYGVQPEKMEKDGGKVTDSQTFDEQELELIKAGAVPPAKPDNATALTGGPRDRGSVGRSKESKR